MNTDQLTNYFKEYLEKPSLFKDRKALQPNYEPENILHREQQMAQIARILAPALKQEKPNNLFIYGKTGTGKTLTITSTTNKLQTVAQKQQVPITIIYVNCKLKKVADTEYRLVAELARQFGKDIPITGLPTDEVYRQFYATLEQKAGTIILVLDEIDQLKGKAGNELLYNLTRINQELKKSVITIVGISNDLLFTDQLDPRVKSSLSEEEIVFPPYDASHLQQILEQRAQKSFMEGAVEPEVIAKCAAYAAREHGDARRAIELLRLSGELAERNNQKTITPNTLDEAEQALDRNSIYELVKSQPQHYQLALWAIIKVCTKNEHVFTGEIYEEYLKTCEELKIRSLTQRRIADIIAEYDMLGVIRAPVISKGRYGRTREIAISIPEPVKEQILTYLEQALGYES